MIKKAKRALETNATYMEFISAPSQYGFYLGFTYNSITSVHLNFQALLNEIFVPFKASFLRRFVYMSFLYEKEKIICDCNIYTDLNFLIEQLGGPFANITGGHMENFDCYLKDSELSLFALINHNSVKRSDFCDLTTAKIDCIVFETESF